MTVKHLAFSSARVMPFLLGIACFIIAGSAAVAALTAQTTVSSDLSSVISLLTTDGTRAH